MFPWHHFVCIGLVRLLFVVFHSIGCFHPDRILLHRYMNRTVAHKDLRMDPDLRDFLTMDADLPKASSTSALSAAGVLRQFGKVRDAVTKLSSTIQETDSVGFTQISLIECSSVFICLP